MALLVLQRAHTSRRLLLIRQKKNFNDVLFLVATSRSRYIFWQSVNAVEAVGAKVSKYEAVLSIFLIIYHSGRKCNSRVRIHMYTPTVHVFTSGVLSPWMA